MTNMGGRSFTFNDLASSYNRVHNVRYLDGSVTLFLSNLNFLI